MPKEKRKKEKAEAEIATSKSNLEKLEKDLETALTELNSKDINDKKLEIDKAENDLSTLRLKLLDESIDTDPGIKLTQLDDAENKINEAKEELYNIVNNLNDKNIKALVEKIKTAKREFDKTKTLNMRIVRKFNGYNSEIEELKLQKQNCLSEKSRLEKEIASLNKEIEKLI